MHHIETTMFDKPSGKVRGMVSVSITLSGKAKQLAHATILVGSEPDISLKVPRSPAVGDIRAISAALAAFAAQVELVNQ